MTPERPDAAVLRAFGVSGVEPVRLPGGRGLTWRTGPVVLRPHDGATVTDWRARVLAALEHTSSFRTPRPVATEDGTWRAGDWESWEHLDAQADPARIEAVLEAGTAFHRAVAHLDRPGFLEDGAPDRGVDAWSRADRMAWDEEPLPTDPTLDRLARAFRPVALPRQLVHGDLLGNVLFADSAPPAVIDWSPYWRPAGWGEAVAVVDAVCWHGVPVDRAETLGRRAPQWPQLLVRALTFRVATLHLLGAWDAAAVAHHRPVVDALT
ncbi:MAG: hypothetical protein ACTHMH_08795 [Curtobacterium sp.]